MRFNMGKLVNFLTGILQIILKHVLFCVKILNKKGSTKFQAYKHLISFICIDCDLNSIIEKYPPKLDIGT